MQLLCLVCLLTTWTRRLHCTLISLRLYIFSFFKLKKSGNIFIDNFKLLTYLLTNDGWPHEGMDKQLSLSFSLVLFLSLALFCSLSLHMTIFLALSLSRAYLSLTLFLARSLNPLSIFLPSLSLSLFLLLLLSMRELSLKRYTFILNEVRRLYAPRI